MAKRQYTKRKKEYWDNFKTNEEDPVEDSKASIQVIPNYEPEFGGSPLMEDNSTVKTVRASRISDTSDQTHLRRNTVTTKPIHGRFSNIEDGLLPYEKTGDNISSNTAVRLTYKSYFNVPVIKSTIDLMSEFANSRVYLTGGTQKSKDFVQAWLDKVKLERVKEQYFLEFYRSGNVFFWRVEAGLTTEGVQTSVKRFNITNVDSAQLPVRYILLNPTEILARDSLCFDENNFVKLLSPYEIRKLKDPKTDDEKAIFKALPDEVKTSIKNGNCTNVYMDLDHDFLHTVFYKKQDYEPLAIPMCFPVLDDVNKKLELKKVDQAITRSIENVILLVTMGAEPDKGGVNANNINAMQNIFRNSSVGRVLVADYTTKAEFIIPDMKRVLGKEKYEVLNRDIQEGLQNVLLGESKFADTSLKLRVFFQRLDESRDIFLRDFLQPEINRVCKEFGLRNPPKAHFTRLDILDNENLQRLVTRMMELSVLTPEQGMNVLNTGKFPMPEDLDDAQEKYVNQREDGKFLPMMSNINEKQLDMQEEQMEKDRENPPQNNNQVEKQKQAGGRPMGKSNSSQQYSVEAITQTIKNIEEFYSKAEKSYKEKSGVKRLNKQKKKVVIDLCQKIVTSSKPSNWESDFIKVCEDNSFLLKLNPLPEVESIAQEHNLDDYASAILYHSILQK